MGYKWIGEMKIAKPDKGRKFLFVFKVLVFITHWCWFGIKIYCRDLVSMVEYRKINPPRIERIE
jgi:hypothetical protein